MALAFLGVGLLILAGLWLWWRWPQSRSAAANRALARGQDVRALELYLDQFSRGSLQPEPRATAAFLALKAERWNDAELLLKNFDDDLALAYRGWIYWHRGNLEKALASWDQGAQKGQLACWAYGTALLVRSARWVEAAEWCKQGLSADSKSPLLLALELEILVAQGDLVGLAAAEKRFRSHKIRSAAGWWGLGLAAQFRGDFQQASQDWQRALDLPFHGLTTVPRSLVEQAAKNPRVRRTSGPSPSKD